jgi:hypothetical protein
MKLMEIYQNTFQTPQKMKLDDIGNQLTNFPDNYDHEESKLLAILTKNDEEEIRYVTISLTYNYVNVPGKTTDDRYDKITGFYKVFWDMDLDASDPNVEYAKYIGVKKRPLNNKVYFIFNLTTEYDRFKKHQLTKLCDRKGVPYKVADGLEGYTDEDFEYLEDNQIRLQSLHEFVVIDRQYLKFIKTITN